MKLYTSRYYNPFFIDLGAKPYEISNILFYDEIGVICSTGHGWFGSGNNNFNVFTIDADCVLKRKIDFNSKTPFIVADGKDILNKTKYALYIPKSVIGLKSPIAINRGRHFVVRWTSDMDGVAVEKWHFIDAELSEVEHRINEVGEKISHLYSNSFSELDGLVKELNSLRKKREKAMNGMLTVKEEDVLKFYR